jgi:hypothetical protein
MIFKPTENIIAHKIQDGKLRVHVWRKQERSLFTGLAMTDCQRNPEWHLQSWLWMEYRHLNLDTILICKQCVPPGDAQ